MYILNSMLGCLSCSGLPVMFDSRGEPLTASSPIEPTALGIVALCYLMIKVCSLVNLLRHVMDAQILPPQYLITQDVMTCHSAYPRNENEPDTFHHITMSSLVNMFPVQIEVDPQSFSYVTLFPNLLCLSLSFRGTKTTQTSYLIIQELASCEFAFSLSVKNSFQAPSSLHLIDQDIMVRRSVSPSQN